MGVLLYCFTIMIMFYMRDVFLFGSTRERVLPKLLVYVALTSLYLSVAMVTLGSLPQGSALTFLRSRWVWALTLITHVGLWRLAVWFKRRPIREGMWTIALAPAPMFILSLILASQGIAALSGGSSVVTFGLILSSAWILLVLLGVTGFRIAYGNWRDDGFVADLADIASWTGLCIVPFTGVGEFAASLLK